MLSLASVTCPQAEGLGSTLESHYPGLEEGWGAYWGHLHSFLPSGE